MMKMDILRLTLHLLVMFLLVVNCEIINDKWERNDSNAAVRTVSVDQRERREFRGANVRRVKPIVAEHEDTNQQKSSDQPHSRQKRLIWITDDGRLALPPGTVLSITPTLSLPLVRHPPDGFLSNITMSFPLTSNFFSLSISIEEYSSFCLFFLSFICS